MEHLVLTDPREGMRAAGCVQVTGAWEGAVLVFCAEELAGAFAAAMFGTPAQEVTDDEVRDALGELANMVAGNVKAQLPSQTQLSLPTVVRGRDLSVDVPGATIETAAGFRCAGLPFSVCLAAKSDSPAS